MNGEMLKFLSFRRGDENRPHPSVLASTRLNGTHPFPAPSLRELSSERETEGVSYDERNRSKISEPIKTVRKSLASINHRTTLPQSALAGCQLPQRGSREGLHHSSGYSLKSNVTGDFHRPYEDSEYFTAQKSPGFHQGNDTGWGRAPTYRNPPKA